MQTGIVSSIYGAYYTVLPVDKPNTALTGKLRGRLRQQRKQQQESVLRDRHPLAVGDRVVYTIVAPDKAGETAGIAIESKLPRRNCLYRSSAFDIQALGANLDLSVLVVSLADPAPNFRFVDRFLVGCHAAEIEPCIVFTKKDIFPNGKISEELQTCIDYYTYLQYQVYTGSLRTSPEETALRLKTGIKGKTTLLAGSSGVGKSTLLNLLTGHSLQRTMDISESTLKGRHTTTTSVLYYAGDETFYIDTPGVKEWGLSHLTDADIYQGFPETSVLATACRFKDCMHAMQSSGCAVQEWFEAADKQPMESMQKRRADSLRAILASLQNPDRMRPGDFRRQSMLQR